MKKDKNKNNNIPVKSKVSIFCTHAIEALWLFLLVALPLFYYRSHQSFNMPKTQLLCITVCFMLVFWAIKGLEEKKFNLRWGAFAVLCGAYLLVLIISAIAGYYPKVSWWGSYVRFEGLSAYIFFIAASFLIFWNIERIAQVKRIFTVAALTVLPISIYGLLQYFGHDFLKFTGSTEGFRNIISTLGNQLYLSDYLIMLLPIILAMVFYVRKTYYKALWIGVAGLDIWALILTGRRSGFVALLAIVLFGGFLLAWRWRKTVAVGLLIILIATAVVGAINFDRIADSSFVQENPYLRRMSRIVYYQEDASLQQRLLIWEISAGLILKRPVVGYGLETYSYVFDAEYPPHFTEMPEVYFDRAHNFILDTAFNSGILGLAALFGLFGLAMFRSLKLFFKEKGTPEAYFGWGISVSLAGFFIHNQFMFESSVTRYILFVLLAIAAALPFLINKAGAENEEGEKAGAKPKFWSTPEFKIIYYALLLIAAVYAARFHVFPIVGDFHYNRGLSYGEGEKRDIRHQEFEKAMYYIRDIRSSRYYGQMARDYFIDAQHVPAEAKGEYFEKSIEYFEKTIEKEEKRFNHYEELAQVYMVWSKKTEDEAAKQEKVEKANSLFEQAISMSPGRQMVWWDWGRSLINAGYDEEGVAKFVHAVSMDPSVGKSYFELGKAYRDTDQPDLARENFDKAYELSYNRGKEDEPL